MGLHDRLSKQNENGAASATAERPVALAGPVNTSQQTPTNNGASDPYALPRIIVDGRDRLVDFACRLRTAERLRDLARRGPLGLARRVVAGPAAVVR